MFLTEVRIMNKNEIDLSMLDHADDDIMEALASHNSPSEEEMERIFNMSRKFFSGEHVKKLLHTPNEENAEVRKIQKILTGTKAVKAAAAVLVAGTGVLLGSMIKGNEGKNQITDQGNVNDQVVTSVTSETKEENNAVETESPITTVNKKNEKNNNVNNPGQITNPGQINNDRSGVIDYRHSDDDNKSNSNKNTNINSNTNSKSNSNSNTKADAKNNVSESSNANKSDTDSKKSIKYEKISVSEPVNLKIGSMTRYSSNYVFDSNGVMRKDAQNSHACVAMALGALRSFSNYGLASRPAPIDVSISSDIMLLNNSERDLSHDDISALCKRYNTVCTWIDSMDEVVNALSSNYPIILDASAEGKFHFASSSHYVLIGGIRQGEGGTTEVLVYDPEGDLYNAKGDRGIWMILGKDIFANVSESDCPFAYIKKENDEKSKIKDLSSVSWNISDNKIIEGTPVNITGIIDSNYPIVMIDMSIHKLGVNYVYKNHSVTIHPNTFQFDLAKQMPNWGLDFSDLEPDEYSFQLKAYDCQCPNSYFSVSWEFNVVSKTE